MRSILILALLNTYILFAVQTTEVTASKSPSADPQSSDKTIDLEDGLLVAAIDKPVVVKDNSGLSDQEVRDIAEASDMNATKKAVSEMAESIAESIENNESVSQKAKQAVWETMSPTPDGHDWVQTTSGEWFKGEIKALYDEELEFDSDEVGDYSFKYKDITQIKSYNVLSVNIEGLASFAGIIRMKDDNITIIQGDGKYEFTRDQVVSAAPEREHEREKWSGKATLSLDMRKGNKDTFDYTAKVTARRRTADTRLRLDYLGRISAVEGTESANDHRINENYNVYLFRDVFWNAIFSEYYEDKFKNIENQYTVGSGLGHTVIDTPEMEWEVSGGPAIIYTRYLTVTEGAASTEMSPALEFNTNLELELTKITDLEVGYKLTYTDDPAGRYKHHMVITLENELTSWLDLDLTTVWDYIKKPTADSDGVTPEKSDFQFLVGLGVDF